jgi:hypothetical protein
MMSMRFTSLAVLLFIVPAHAAHGADDDGNGWLDATELEQQGFQPLFDGASLEAWDVKPWHEGHWVARDGVIDYDGKSTHRRFNTNSLWTKQPFGDCTLYAEWRLPAKPREKPHPIVLYNGDFLRDETGNRVTRSKLDAGDSGILLRGALKCQANIWSQELGSGEVNGYRTDVSMPPEVRRACIPICNADRPLGEWNAFLISLSGSRMIVHLNGTPVVDVVLPDLPPQGPIGLQHHGDPVQFRQVWVNANP